jgi:hypothetical protein
VRALLTSTSGWQTLIAMSLRYGVVQLDVTIVNAALNSIGASCTTHGGTSLWLHNAGRPASIPIGHVRTETAIDDGSWVCDNCGFRRYPQ